MAQEYTVSNWQPWTDKETDELIRDTHGNFKGTVWFDEDPRQADATFKTQPAVGDKKYGDLADYQTKAGKIRLGFKRADRPDAPSASQTTFSGTAPSNHSTEDSIARAVALKAAVELTASDDRLMRDKATVLEMADRFVEWLQGGSESTDPKATSNQSGQAPTTELSGYEQAKAQREKIHPDSPNADERAEMASLAKSLDQGTEIDLNTIPF